jgi:hypothetical protein
LDSGLNGVSTGEIPGSGQQCLLSRGKDGGLDLLYLLIGVYSLLYLSLDGVDNWYEREGIDDMILLLSLRELSGMLRYNFLPLRHTRVESRLETHRII